MERLSGEPLGEQNTKAALISPVLRALGWDVEDVEQVRHEYRHQRSDSPVDHALLLSRVPQLFVEAKGYGENLADRKWAGQVVSYAAVAGVSWVALTDGNEWRLYNAHAPVDVEDKLFRQFRISDDRAAAAEALGYLARENITQAREVLSSLWEADRADRAVRQKVDALFAEDPPRMVCCRPHEADRPLDAWAGPRCAGAPARSAGSAAANPDSRAARAAAA